MYVGELKKDIPLPKDSNIRFVLDSGEISIHPSRDEIAIYGSTAIAVIPRAANCCKIWIIE